MAPSQIEAGGRNLLSGTGNSITGVGNNADNQIINGYNLAGGKKVSDLYKQYGPSEHLTLSFDWTASGETISGDFLPQWNDIPWSGLANSGVIKPSSTNKSGHYTSTVQLNSDGYSTGVATGIGFRMNDMQGSLTISNMKLEAGNKPTDTNVKSGDSDNKPTDANTIEEIKAYLDKHGIAHNGVTLKADLLALIK
ncbi:hypothetical protein [Fructilactobacillus sanfranciscensis]|uniref:hypothetical protein n=1 Tax=Fructilactobacillus sanfranciscensis TaxID=1625 RepID=UPI0013D5E8AA|nr:hypothetical protein [Fructilactobacillus sanfranciscensis]NDR97418.1 hypothetical protein [Fructilactobacillus sanfranciscensis]